jgi:hypothetical protein
MALADPQDGLKYVLFHILTSPYHHLLVLLLIVLQLLFRAAESEKGDPNLHSPEPCVPPPDQHNAQHSHARNQRKETNMLLSTYSAPYSSLLSCQHAVRRHDNLAVRQYQLCGVLEATMPRQPTTLRRRAAACHSSHCHGRGFEENHQFPAAVIGSLTCWGPEPLSESRFGGCFSTPDPITLCSASVASPCSPVLLFSCSAQSHPSPFLSLGLRHAGFCKYHLQITSDVVVCTCKLRQAPEHM